MTRIAAGLLIVASVLAFNSGFLTPAQAEDQALRVRLEAVKTASCPAPVESRASRVASLLMCLSALQQGPGVITPKV